MAEAGVVQSQNTAESEKAKAPAAGGELVARWGQPLTGIISLVAFTLIAWITWYIFSDPRGPIKMFPYPFVMYLAMMILVGLWQHMFLGDWPFEKLPQPTRGIVQTILNLFIVWFVIHIVFYKILGLGFNFLSQSNLEAMAAAGQAGKLDLATMQAKHFAESAVVCFVLIGFYSYPFVTILFGKWPVRPSDLPQPQAGLAEIGWCSHADPVFLCCPDCSHLGMALWRCAGQLIRTEHPLVGRYRGIYPCPLGLRLVGMGHYRALHDRQCMEHEALVTYQSAAAVEGAGFIFHQHGYRLCHRSDLRQCC